MGRAGLAARLLGLALAALPPAAAAHEGHAPPPGAGVRSRYAFPLPAPGSYSLPPIKPAGDGRVLDEDGREQALRQLFLDRVSVVAFIYTRCGDLCPAASLDMSQLQDLAAKDKRVSRRMRLVTISFDPEHDTPQTMRDYAAQFRSAAAAPEWLFLTAPDRAALAPVLAAYNQAVDAKADPASAGGPLNHIFRAFLIDRAGQVRNIYSLDFFDPKLVLNDVRSLLLDDGAGARSRGRSSHTNPPASATSAR
jgi:protein SCO1